MKRPLLVTLILTAAAFSAYKPAWAQDNYVQNNYAPVASQGQNQYCREYTRKVVIGNAQREAYGTACQQPDGSWQIMNQASGPPPVSGAVVDPTYQPVPPPPVGANVTYVIQDDVPIYVEPAYIHYGFYQGYGHGYGRGYGYGGGFYRNGPGYRGRFNGGYGGGYNHHHFNQ